MSGEYGREMYQELYSIRSRIESVEANVREVVSGVAQLQEAVYELTKIRRMMEEQLIESSGHGYRDPSEGQPRKAESEYKISKEKKKKFGLF